jgi:NADH-quinone oxidoreductase subunit L
MPVTFVTFTLGYLALIGFPFLSGFYTKDLIIEASLTAGPVAGWIFGVAALLAAGLTAFYMTRLVLMTFFGKERWRDQKSVNGNDFHPHEASPVMWVPMVILAVGSIGAGAYLSIGHRLSDWLTPSLGALQERSAGPLSSIEITILTLVLAAIGVLVAFVVVGRRDVPVVRPERVSWPVRAARANLYGDALNETLIARPGLWLDRALVFGDKFGIDGAVNGIGILFRGSSGRLRKLQTGFVRSYALSMLGGAIVLIGALLLVRFSG